jgi:hypothetical protein
MAISQEKRIKKDTEEKPPQKDLKSKLQKLQCLETSKPSSLKTEETCANQSTTKGKKPTRKRNNTSLSLQRNRKQPSTITVKKEKKENKAGSETSSISSRAAETFPECWGCSEQLADFPPCACDMCGMPN